MKILNGKKRTAPENKRRIIAKELNMNREKVICPCYGVTKGDIADAIEQGATSYKEVKKITKAGKACGKCRKKVKKLVKKLTLQSADPEKEHGKKKEKKNK